MMNNQSTNEHKSHLSENHTQSSSLLEQESLIDEEFAEENITYPPNPPSGILKNFLILLLSGFCVFLLTPYGRDWRLTLPHSLTQALPEEKPPQKLISGNILTVNTMQVQPITSYPVSRTYTGSLVARRSSELGFERPGKLVRIMVDEGDWVTANTPLAYLDTSNLKTQEQELMAKIAQEEAKLQEMKAGPRSQTIDASQASVQDLTAQLELAKRKRARREILYREGAISREQLDEVSSETNVLQARVEEAKSRLEELQAGTRPEQIKAQQAIIKQLNANLANLKIELEKSVLKAPFSGKIAVRLVDEGTVITVGQSLLRLVESGSLEARIGMPTNVAEQLPIGSYQTLQIGENSYQGKVSSILPEIDLKTRTATVVLTLNPSAAQQVSSGQVARLKWVENVPTDGYWIPTSALIQGSQGLWSCYVLGEQINTDSVEAQTQPTFKIERRDVEILQTQSDRVLVRGTLKANEQIIIDGVHRLVPGQLVTSY